MSGALIEVIKDFEQKNELWQWDTGRQIKITPGENAIVDEVHFSNAYSKDALVVKPQVNEQGNIVADIPNILLWQVFPINVYVVMDFPNGKGTIYEEQLKINPRKKPSDYVYTETEILNYLDLEKRIKALEENGTGGITEETDPTVPQWAKYPTKPSYTADEVGAPTKEEFDEFVLKHEEEFDKLSDDIADLKGGQTTASGWTNAQIDLLDEIGNYLPFTTANGGKKWDELIASLRSGASDEPDVPEEPDNPEVTLTSISATYNGGEVATGTALTDLTGITVTATYSDGTTKAVTGYTLSGEILEGENTITVSYEGKTATFTVVGVAESGGDVTSELITDGLVNYFDLRTAEYDNSGSGGSTIIQPTQGNGQLFTWANNVITSQNDNGIAANRGFIYSTDKSTNQADFGTEFTIIALTKEGVFSGDFGVIRTNVTTGWSFKGKYNTSTSSVNTDDKGEGNYDSVSDYNFQATRVKGNAMKVIFDTSYVEFDGTSYDDFVSWNSKSKSIGTVYGMGTFVALAIYNRSLSDVEIEEMRAFMKTLEVA